MPGPSIRAFLGAMVLLSGFAVSDALAETRACTGCYVGVYDDVAMTRTTGTIGLFEVKSVYLGVRLTDGVRLSKLDLEASYPGGFTVVDYTSYVANARITPTDTGVRVEWPTCVTGTRVLFRVRVITLSSVRNAVVQLRNAIGTGCPAASGTEWLIPAGCYVLNPGGNPRACATGVEPSTWSRMKDLFK
jgi:hypothetical protein